MPAPWFCPAWTWGRGGKSSLWGSIPREGTSSPPHPRSPPLDSVTASSGFHSGWGLRACAGRLDCRLESPHPCRPRGSAFPVSRLLTTGGAGWWSPGCSETGRFSEAGIWSSSRPNPPAPQPPSWSWQRQSRGRFHSDAAAFGWAGRFGGGGGRCGGRGYGLWQPRSPASLPSRGGQGRKPASLSFLLATRRSGFSTPARGAGN